jgi:hypothetical protein
MSRTVTPKAVGQRQPSQPTPGVGCAPGGAWHPGWAEPRSPPEGCQSGSREDFLPGKLAPLPVQASFHAQEGPWRPAGALQGPPGTGGLSRPSTNPGASWACHCEVYSRTHALPRLSRQVLPAVGLSERVIVPRADLSWPVLPVTCGA